MDSRGSLPRAPAVVAGLGVALFLAALVHHATELRSLDQLAGPAAAFLLDGPPALGLAYGGYWLSGTDLPPRDRWTVGVRCLAGAVLFVAVIGATFLVRAAEGRAVAEPAFPLLIAAEAGAAAGFVAGYYTARARADARRARTVSDALGFVNDLLRHDLRNDLSVIRGRAELVDDGTEEGTVVAGKAEEALARIETTGAVTETLIGDPELEPVDLAAVVEEMAASVGEAFEAEVTVDTPGPTPVTANAGLRSVVDNLLENAAEHNDADDPRVHAEVAVDGGTVRLSVSDNGPGIPDDLKSSLFDDDGAAAGAGGLSLVATLVEGYGGDVRVEDNEPRGTRLVVELPRADRGAG